MLDQSGPGSNGNGGVLHISQSPSINGISQSDCLVSYTGHSWGRSYPSAEVQSVYSTAPADWANLDLKIRKKIDMKVAMKEYFHLGLKSGKKKRKKIRDFVQINDHEYVLYDLEYADLTPCRGVRPSTCR